MALISVAINFVYEYFSFVIYFSKIFFPKFFFDFFFFKFFSKNSFPTSFQNMFFEGFALDALPFTEIKRTLCICVMKNMIYRPI